MVLLMTEEVEEKRIVTEFCHLLEKSKQLFNGLRDLPPYGYKQWQTYFCRTFDVYTKLWKFQQQHRPTLDKIYCLKRWQIGEIASKIGQLYYHYYLRTSELHYLHESAAFYGAIRSRGYYNRKDERNEFLIKKLRYLARFILVCLLLRRMKLVKELVHELSEHIEDYSNTPMYEAEDHLEWTFVLGDVLSFLQAEAPLTICIPNRHQLHGSNHKVLHGEDFDGDDEKEDEDDDGTTGELIFIPTYRMSSTASAPAPVPSTSSDSVSSSTAAVSSPPAHVTVAVTSSGSSTSASASLNLQEVLIVCTKSDQIKFSEYTIDMYRMLQTLEREPTTAQLAAAAGSNSNNSNGETGTTGDGSAQDETHTSTGGAIESSVDILEVGPSDDSGTGTQPLGADTNEERSHSNHTAVTNNTSSTSTSNPCNNDSRQVQPGHVRQPGAAGSGTDKLNPHKHLLYKPSIEQLLLYLSNSLKCLSHDGVLLVYISGDTVSPPPPASTPALDGTANGEGLTMTSTNPFRPRPIAVSPPSNSSGYEAGGIAMVSPAIRKESQGNANTGGGGSGDSKQQAVIASTSKCQRKDKQCLYPGDLLPFSRKPLVLVIDSENSHIFSELLPNTSNNLFTAPTLILMSPTEVPALLHETQPPGSGSLFTHFLHSPFSAFANVCQITKVTKSKWNSGQEIIGRFMTEAGRLYVESCATPGAGSATTVSGLGHHHHNNTGLEFFSDEFLRVLILRFIFCETVLRMHKAFQYSSRCFPRSQPNLVNQIKLGGGVAAFGRLQSIASELVRLLGVDDFFTTTSGGESTAPSNYDQL